MRSSEIKKVKFVDPLISIPVLKKVLQFCIKIIDCAEFKVSKSSAIPEMTSKIPKS